ncbi:glycosyltransferase family 2 protein [Flammeovirga pectinis]|uniref:Glycosyltransferase family 2 protein n=1 Tax=Flammeovirga pectinis TaxID=2494373 RepID=A0A3S9P190_9BACT|nr:glycosyltransferase family 2 protein [Flammeovirga pectinis]AZQ61915.1 glycosyltransferase family 2 protein [Flammeovirga pectinis]
MELSIIIINYNTFELTCQCIDSIYKETKGVTFEIILVDNASKECDPKLFSDKYPDIKLIENKVNQGFGRANNKGMELAKGNFFLLLNSDTIIINNVVNKGVHYLNQDKKNGVYSCHQINDISSIKEPEYSFFFKDFSLFYLLKNIPFIQIIYSKYLNKSSKQFSKGINKVNNVSGAFMLLKHEVFEKTKGFDPDFFLYSEETEWCTLRINKKWNILFSTEEKFIHLEGKSGVKDFTLNQDFLSTAFTWYKKGYFEYFSFLFIHIFLYYPSWLILFFVVKSENKKRTLRLIKIFNNCFKQLIFDIPKYKNNYGARKNFLRYK